MSVTGVDLKIDALDVVILGKTRDAKEVSLLLWQLC